MNRLLRYVQIDTQSPRTSRSASTKKQLDLANCSLRSLKDLGVKDVRISEWGIIYGMVSGKSADNSKVPTIGFISHMDTSRRFRGANVNAIIHKNYQGGDIVLPNDKTQVYLAAKNPDLKISLATTLLQRMARRCLAGRQSRLRWIY
jgi:tripeptide aminopeptidase